MRFIGDLNVDGEILELKPENLASDPGSPIESQMWWNSTSKVMKYYDGTEVKTISEGGNFDDFINKDGSVAMTGELTLSSSTPSAALSAASKGYVDTEVATKEDTITGAATTITGTDLTINRALLSDGSGKVAVSTVTSTELGYVSGVTSSIQSQLDGKEGSLGYTPVNVAGDTMTGNLAFGGSYTVTGLVAPSNGTDAATKAYVDAAIAGLDFQADVLDVQTDNTLDPGATPTTGDRYIITDSGNLHPNFGTITGLGDGDIVEYDGADFVVVYDVSAEGAGAIAWSTDDASFQYYDGSSWGEFGGIDALVAGVGLVKSGNTLNINMGAGIAQLPSDEVGIDVHTTGALELIDPTLETASTATDAVIAVKLDGSTLARAAGGLSVANAGVTETQLATSVAGNGITGGNGTSLSVVADTGISVSGSGVAFDTTFGDARYATLTGATFTGSVVLDADPTVALGAATKQYVDAVDTDLTTLSNRLDACFYDSTLLSSNTSFTINHNIGTQYVHVTVIDSSGYVVIPQDIQFNSTSQCTVTLSTAEAVRVIVTGLNPA